MVLGTGTLQASMQLIFAASSLAPFLTMSTIENGRTATIVIAVATIVVCLRVFIVDGGSATIDNDNTKTNNNGGSVAIVVGVAVVLLVVLLQLLVLPW